jgi:hypothetical protein
MRNRSFLKALGLFFLGVFVLSGCTLPGKSVAKEAKDLPEQEEIHYESVTGIMLEALGTKPSRIISKKGNRYPWIPEKTIFLSQSGEPMDPMEFITTYKGKSIALYLDEEGTVVLARRVDM